MWARSLVLHVVLPLFLAQTCTVTQLAGGGAPGSADGVAASFALPYGLAISRDGTSLFVTDAGNYNVRLVHVATANVSTIAGTVSGGAPVAGTSDGPGTSAGFLLPLGVDVRGSDGAVFVADYAANAVRMLLLDALSAEWVVSTVLAADFPAGVAVSPDSTSLLVTLYADSTIVQYSFDTGARVVLAGVSGSPGAVDGPLGTALLRAPFFLDWPIEGTFLFSDQRSALLRTGTGAGSVTTIAGSVADAATALASGTASGGYVDGAALAAAKFGGGDTDGQGLAQPRMDATSREVFATDFSNNAVRALSPDWGTVRTVVDALDGPSGLARSRAGGQDLLFVSERGAAPGVKLLANCGASPPPSPSGTGTSSSSPSTAPMPSGVPSPSPTPSVSPSASGTPSATPSDSGTPSNTPSPSGTPSVTPSRSGTPSATPLRSGAPLVSRTGTPSASAPPANASPSAPAPPDATLSFSLHLSAPVEAATLLAGVYSPDFMGPLRAGLARGAALPGGAGSVKLVRLQGADAAIAVGRTNPVNTVRRRLAAPANVTLGFEAAAPAPSLGAFLADSSALGAATAAARAVLAAKLGAAVALAWDGVAPVLGGGGGGGAPEGYAGAGIAGIAVACVAAAVLLLASIHLYRREAEKLRNVNGPAPTPPPRGGVPRQPGGAPRCACGALKQLLCLCWEPARRAPPLRGSLPVRSTTLGAFAQAQAPHVGIAQRKPASLPAAKASPFSRNMFGGFEGTNPMARGPPTRGGPRGPSL